MSEDTKQPESFKVQSTKNWCPDRHRQLENEEIMIGCLQRIADASEKSAVNITDLQNRLKWITEDRDRLRNDVTRLSKSNASLRGHMKRIKKTNEK